MLLRGWNRRLNVRVLTFANSLPAAHRVPLCFSNDSWNNIDSAPDNINGRVILIESRFVFFYVRYKLNT